MVGKLLVVRLIILALRGPSARKKKHIFIYAPILMGFFSSEVKFNFKTLLLLSNF